MGANRSHGAAERQPTCSMVVGYGGRSHYKAGTSQFPTDPAIRTQALKAVQDMRAISGSSDLVLLNAEHGVMVLADNVLQQT
jgi:hypothetical protein